MVMEPVPNGWPEVMVLIHVPLTIEFAPVEVSGACICKVPKATWNKLPVLAKSPMSKPPEPLTGASTGRVPPSRLMVCVPDNVQVAGVGLLLDNWLGLTVMPITPPITATTLVDGL